MATTALRIGPADHGRIMTLEEFREADEEDGYRYELARGVVHVADVPDDSHGETVYKFYCVLACYHQEHPGTIYRYGGAGEFRLWLPGMVSARNPDVAVVLRGTPRNSRGRRSPSLVVEIVSPGDEQRDYQDKRAEYLAYGLLESWIVDPQARRVLVLIRNGDARIERVFAGEQVAEGLALPGFVIPLADLWAEDQDQEEGPEKS